MYPPQGTGTGGIQYNISRTPEVDSIPLSLSDKPIIDFNWLLFGNENRNPTVNDIPPIDNALFLNNVTGEIFVFLGICNDKAIWKGTNGTVIDPSFDIFGDNSAVALFTFDNTLDDYNGIYHGITRGSGISFVSGKLNKSVKIENNSYIEYDTYNFGLPNRYVISLWLATKFTGQQCAFTFSRSGNNQLNIFFHTRNGNLIEVNINNSTVYRGNDFDVADGKFHHIVITSNGELIIDKNVLATGLPTADLQSCNNNFIIGADRDGSSINDYFNGLIDHFRIFDRDTLTPDELDILFSETVC